MNAIGCMALMMGISMGSTSVNVVRQSTEAFNNRNYEKLFTEYYADNMEVRWHPDWQVFAKVLDDLKDPNINKEEKLHLIENGIVSVPGELAYENMDAIRAQIKKQFESTEDLAADIIELDGIGPYAILHQRKARLGETVEGYILYYIVDGRIQSLWMAKKQ